MGDIEIPEGWYRLIKGTSFLKGDRLWRKPWLSKRYVWDDHVFSTLHLRVDEADLAIRRELVF